VSLIKEEQVKTAPGPPELGDGYLPNFNLRPLQPRLHDYTTIDKAEAVRDRLISK
jgi:hypothetical protein